MIYQRKSSKNWIAAWYVKRPNGSLWKKCVSTKTADKSEARAIEASLVAASRQVRERRRIEDIIVDLAERIHGIRPSAAVGYPLASVWDKFASLPKNRGVPERTLAAKRQAWNRLMTWLEAEHPDITTMQDIPPRIAADFLATLSGASTHNRTKTYLSSIWKGVALAADLGEVNPWPKTDSVAERPKSYRDFSLEEVQAILLACDTVAPYWRPLVIVGYYTGMREIDCVMLERSHFTEDGFIELVPTKTRRTGKRVRIWVHTDLAKMLSPLLKAMPKDQDLLFPEAAERHGGPEFGREFGQILVKASVSEDHRGRVGFPSLRHALVTSLEKSGVERRIVQGIVGHGSDSVTRRYSHDTDSSRIIETALPSLTRKKRPARSRRPKG